MAGGALATGGAGGARYESANGGLDTVTWLYPFHNCFNLHGAFWGKCDCCGSKCWTTATDTATDTAEQEPKQNTIDTQSQSDVRDPEIQSRHKFR